MTHLEIQFSGAPIVTFEERCPHRIVGTARIDRRSIPSLPKIGSSRKRLIKPVGKAGIRSALRQQMLHPRFDSSQPRRLREAHERVAIVTSKHYRAEIGTQSQKMVELSRQCRQLKRLR